MTLSRCVSILALLVLPGQAFDLDYTYILAGSADDELNWFREPILTRDGSLYLAGCTKSPDFPVTPNALFPKYRGGNNWGTEDAFLVQFNTGRRQIEYATYFGGAGGPDFISDVRQGPGKRIYVTGNTGAPDFPTTPNAHSRKFSGPDFRHADGFFAIFGANGRRLEYSSFIGGSGNDWAERVYRDAGGRLTVLGVAASQEFPSPSRPAGPVLFSMTLDRDGRRMLDSRVFGKCWNFDAQRLTGGGFVVAGTTNDPAFPTTGGAWDRSFNGGEREAGGDVFALWTTPQGEISASTFLGGSGDESVPVIAALSDNEIVIAGGTRSKDLPTTPDALAATPAGEGPWAYIARLDERGKRLAYCSYLPGARYTGRAAHDGRGRVYIAGSANSAALPVTADALQPAYKGGVDGFLLVFNATAKKVEYCSYVGGSKEDRAETLALGPRGEVYLIGTTNSDDFPGAQSPRRGIDVFVMKVRPRR